ncbi:MAG TPA: DUF429 domain-containing protein [Mycobacteriales bacterium]|nr:DUF429 domain-containing protein [Mycobacteriales bacterium]
MTRVAGVDGCPGGWIAAVVEDDGTGLTWQRRPDAAGVLGLLDHPGVAVIGIDIPIGLPSPGEVRACDRLARARLGPRRSCVFPAPARVVLAEDDFWRANEVSRRVSGVGLSKQAFFIGARIVDVDRAVDAGLADRVIEVHPELTFARLAGRPIGTKKTAQGIEERARLLQTWVPDIREHVARRPPRVRADDALDAVAAAWTAARWTQGSADTLPADPVHDERGLPMRIVT